MRTTDQQEEGRLIGMVHLKTLPGYAHHEGMAKVMAQALADARALEKGGADAILVENTEDDPHRVQVGPETVAAMTLAVRGIVDAVRTPVGVCALWNDARASLAIAKVAGARFVRIPVFTEAVLASCGMIEADPYAVMAYRQLIGAGDIRILADVHVKHATLLTRRPIEESAREALDYGADEVIITGRFTGDAVDLAELRRLRAGCPHATITIGSGTTMENVLGLLAYADRFIVGTSLKDADGNIDPMRVRALKEAMQGAMRVA